MRVGYVNSFMNQSKQSVHSMVLTYETAVLLHWFDWKIWC